MNIRINSIQCRSCDTTYRYEIIKWFPNTYYGLKNDYLNKGYVEEDGFVQSDNHRIQSTIFESEESCYVIAWLDYNHKEPDVDLRSVGSRLLALTKDDLDCFFDVYNIANKMIIEQYENGK